MIVYPVNRLSFDFTTFFHILKLVTFLSFSFMVTRKVAPVETNTMDCCNNGQGISMNLLTVLVVISIVINAFGLYLLLGFNFSFASVADIFGIKIVFLDVVYSKVFCQKNFDIVSI